MTYLRVNRQDYRIKNVIICYWRTLVSNLYGQQHTANRTDISTFHDINYQL